MCFAGSSNLFFILGSGKIKLNGKMFDYAARGFACDHLNDIKIDRLLSMQLLLYLRALAVWLEISVMKLRTFTLESIVEQL